MRSRAEAARTAGGDHGALLAPLRTVAPPELDGVASQALPLCALGCNTTVSPIPPALAGGALFGRAPEAFGNLAIRGGRLVYL